MTWPSDVPERRRDPARELRATELADILWLAAMRQNTQPDARPVLDAPALVPALRSPAPEAPSTTAAPASHRNYADALRPLRRAMRGDRAGTTKLNEIATAERAMETGQWWPVLRATPERLVDLTVVVDESPSMTSWRPRTREFALELERSGAFRSVRVRRFDAGDPMDRGGIDVAGRAGRRAVLVVTDGLGDAWQSYALNSMLAQWGRQLPVSIVNVLPQWQWRRSRLPVHSARLTVGGRLRPNSRWRLELPDEEIGADRPADPRAVPIPVLELQPRWLSWWAGLIMGEHRAPISGTVVFTADHRDDVATADHIPPAREQVGRFRSLASPPAQRLATLLAAVPVDLAVIELVRERFVPESGPEHFAELIVSGVLTPVRTGESTQDTQAFDFPADVRESLLGGGLRTETARVIRTAAESFADRLPVLGHLRDAIADPDNSPDPILTPGNRPDVALEIAVMRALSGPYLSRADRLSNAILDEGPPALPAPTLITDPGETDENMTNTAERRRRNADETPQVWGNVPPRNHNFTGRGDLLDQLGKRLSAGGTTAILPSALHGMGGIGKTQLAVEFVYRHLQDYDLVWWIDAARTIQIRSAFTELAHYLGLIGSAEPSTAIPAVREALRTGRPYRRWLLVFDAADSPDTVRPFFPTNGPGEILITSRNPDWAGVARPLELAVFSRAESIELLSRRGPKIDRQEADTLAEKLGDLPLAIEQAAAWRSMTGMPIQEYLRLFDESVAEILDTSAPTDYEVSVAAAWNVSFDELRTRNPVAHQILQICAYLSPEPITRDLFTGVSRVSISPELDEALRDPIKLARAVRDINRYGLAKIDHGSNTIQLHRLVQLVLRNRVMAPQIQAQMRHGAHQLLASMDPNDPESARNWPRYRELLPHAYAADVVDCADAWVRQFVINLMRFLFAFGDPEEASHLGMRMRSHFTELLGPEHAQTIEASRLLGTCLSALGRYAEATELNQRTMALQLQVSGPDNEEMFAIQANVVADLHSGGDFEAAAKLSAEIYDKVKRMFGDDDPESLNAAHQHALSLRLVGQYPAAAALDADTLRRRSEVLGPDHPLTLSSNAALVVDWREAGDYTKARVEQEKLTASYRVRFEADSPLAVSATAQLALALRRDGDDQGALTFSAEALGQLRLLYGDDSPTTTACMLVHSTGLRVCGDLAAARTLGEEAFARFRNLFGERHPHTLAATVGLAVTLRKLGQVDDAQELDKNAFEHFLTGLSPDHPYTILTSINLASDLATRGYNPAAVQLNTDALVRGTRVLGDDHPISLAAALNLGLDLTTAGRKDEAERYLVTNSARYRERLGEKHPATIAALADTRADCDIDVLLL